MEKDITNAVKELFSLCYENGSPVIILGIPNRENGRTYRAMCGSGSDQIMMIGMAILESHHHLAEQNPEMPPLEDYLKTICKFVNENKDILKK